MTRTQSTVRMAAMMGAFLAMFTVSGLEAHHNPGWCNYVDEEIARCLSINDCNALVQSMQGECFAGPADTCEGVPVCDTNEQWGWECGGSWPPEYIPSQTLYCVEHE